MKKGNLIALGIAIALFIAPFFWLKPGFVDLGGDAGKLYFLDPLASALNLFKNQTPIGALMYSMVFYEFFLYILKNIIISPTSMIAVDHGLQLALGFFSIYLIVKELCSLVESVKKETYISWIAIISGLVYAGLVTKVDWAISMQTQNQVFLNPLIFYLLLRFLVTSRIFYAFALLLVTFLYAGNFGFTSTPQITSFFPFALLFLGGLFRFVYKKPFPWKRLCLLGLLFVGLHAFHIIPSLAAVLDKGSVTYNTIFSGEAIQNSSVHYFDVNHRELGKISVELFQPSQWHGQNLFILLVPLIAFLAFLRKPSKLLALLGLFFAVTLFLVSANITSIGVRFYRSLFYIPGFMMFRSFNEKWYFVYSFFYTLLFAASFYYVFAKKQAVIAFLVGFCVIGSIGYRIYPFVQGMAVRTTQYQSNNVSSTFMMDPDLIDAIAYVKKLPDDGKALTLPLTFPYFQIAYGKEGGAYEGISMVQNIGGKKDYPGFWSFGIYKEPVFTSLRKEDMGGFIQLLSLLNVRYVFRNSDSRVMDNFPGYPYIYPGDMYDTKNKVPSIKDQSAYTQLLTYMPLIKKFEKNFYHVYEIEDSYIRPTVYIPDVIYASQEELLHGSSYRSAYGDDMVCKTLELSGLRCDGISVNGTLPDISFTKLSETRYGVTFDMKKRKDPFLVVFSEDYHASWKLKFDGKNNGEGVTHVRMNGYANGWIIDPAKSGLSGKMNGLLYLGFQQYYVIGRIVSGITLFLIIVLFIRELMKRIYEKK